MEVVLEMNTAKKQAAAKNALLKAHGLSTEGQNFHFYPDRLDERLLTATRIQALEKKDGVCALCSGVLSYRSVPLYAALRERNI